MIDSWHGMPRVEDLVKSYKEHMSLGPTVKLSREEQIHILDLYDNFDTERKTNDSYAFTVDWDLYIGGREAAKLKAEDPDCWSDREYNILTGAYCKKHESGFASGPQRYCKAYNIFVPERDLKKTINQQRAEMGCKPVDSPEVYISLTWTAVTADQIEKIAKFAAELGVQFNLNMQDPIYGEDEDDTELTHG